MKLLFNIFSTVSFIGVVGIVGGGAYVFVNKDAIIDNVKEAAIEQVMEALPGMMSGALPGGDLAGDLPISGEAGGGGLPIPGGLPF